MSARVDIFGLNEQERRQYLSGLTDEELSLVWDEIFDQLEREFKSVMSDLRALAAHHPTLYH